MKAALRKCQGKVGIESLVLWLIPGYYGDNCTNVCDLNHAASVHVYPKAQCSPWLYSSVPQLPLGHTVKPGNVDPCRQLGPLPMPTVSLRALGGLAGPRLG